MKKLVLSLMVVFTCSSVFAQMPYTQQDIIQLRNDLFTYSFALSGAEIDAEERKENLKYCVLNECVREASAQLLESQKYLTSIQRRYLETQIKIYLIDPVDREEVLTRVRLVSMDQAKMISDLKKQVSSCAQESSNAVSENLCLRKTTAQLHQFMDRLSMALASHIDGAKQKYSTYSNRYQ